MKKFMLKTLSAVLIASMLLSSANIIYGDELDNIQEYEENDDIINEEDEDTFDSEVEEVDLEIFEIQEESTSNDLEELAEDDLKPIPGDKSQVNKDAKTEEYSVEDEPSKMPLTRGLTNIDPNNALYISEDYYGAGISDIADSNSRWYVFESDGTNKVSITLLQQGSGDYDIYLYKLNGNMISGVDFSYNVGGYEQISYIADTGVYYLEIAPYIPATTSYNYNFAVDVTDNYDEYEVNDFPAQAISFTNGFEVSATIDNAFDEDWYKFTSSDRELRYIQIDNIPAGEYAIYVFDSDLAPVISYLANSAIANFGVMPGEEYYVRVVSYTGNYVDEPYTLKVVKAYYGSEITRLSTGHVIAFTDTSLAIDGVNVDFDGEYRDVGTLVGPNIKESIVNDSSADITVYNQACSFSFYDGVSYSKNAQVIVVELTEGYYHGTTVRNNQMHMLSVDSGKDDLDLGDHYHWIHPQKLPVIIDLNTGEVLDCPYSIKYVRKDLWNMTFQTPRPI